MAEREKGKSCGTCHSGAKALGIDNCSACHPNPSQIAFKVKETGPTLFGHSNQVAMYKCGVCYSRLYTIGANKHVSMATMAKDNSRGACRQSRLLGERKL